MRRAASSSPSVTSSVSPLARSVEDLDTQSAQRSIAATTCANRRGSSMARRCCVSRLDGGRPRDPTAAAPTSRSSSATTRFSSRRARGGRRSSFPRRRGGRSEAVLCRMARKRDRIAGPDRRRHRQPAAPFRCARVSVASSCLVCRNQERRVVTAASTMRGPSAHVTRFRRGV